MRKWLIIVVAAVALLALSAKSPQRTFGTTALPLRPGISVSDRVTVDLNQTNLAQALIMYSELTARTQLPKTSPTSQQLDEFFGGYLSRWHLVKRPASIRSGIEYHRDGLFTVGEVKEQLEKLFAANGLVLVPDGSKHFRAIRPSKP
jgi:hypothetical protein